MGWENLPPLTEIDSRSYDLSFSKRAYNDYTY
jgi:hypothetical protein